MFAIKNKLGFLLFSAVMALTQGCATGPNANPVDPLEPFNRTMFQLNDSLDRAVLKPVATVYDRAVPSLVQAGAENFFSNIRDAWSVVNNALQLKPKEAVETFMRVSVNTVFGFGGLLDIGGEMRLERNRQDFGRTLGVWGINPGPYLVLPLFGPSSVRDAVGTLVDGNFDPVANIVKVPPRNSLTALRLVNARASLLSTTNALDEAALDRYTFAREVYLKRRSNADNKEAPPAEERFDLPAPTSPQSPALTTVPAPSATPAPK